MALIKISRLALTSLDQEQRDALTRLIRKQCDTFAQDIQACLNANTEESDLNTVFLFTTQGHIIGFCLGALSENKAHLRHLLIDRNNQSKGLGQNMMYGMFRQLMQSGIDQVRLNSQQRQLDWLEKHGFIQLELAEAKTPNRDFELINPSLRHYMQSRPKDASASQHMRLGLDNETQRFDREESALALHRNMLLQARRRIWLMADTSRDPVIMQNETALAMIQLVKRNPQADIRLLLADDRQGAGYYNPTIQAIQKLSSYCEIRTLQKTGQRMAELYNIVDFDGCLQRKSYDDWRGQANYNSRLMCNRFSQEFEQLWQYARPSMELRRLAL